MVKSDTWGTAWMVLALMLGAALVVVTALLPPTDALSWGTFWQAAAAIATAGAAGVALSASTRDARWRNEERARAQQVDKFYIASLVPTLLENIMEFNDLKTQFEGVLVSSPASCANAHSKLKSVIALLEPIDCARVSSVGAEPPRVL
jgi:hypothetical protein